MPETPVRVGVFGGTFDPIHVAHLAIAAAAHATLGLQKVLFVVANSPWQKLDSGRVITPAPDRLAVVEAAVSGDDRFEASDIEIRRGGDSYTVETLSELAASLPGVELHLIVGSDLLPELHTWKRFDELENLAHLAVVARPGSMGAQPPEGWRYTVVESPPIDLSSSDLREAMAAGRSVEYLIPESALRLIDERALYPSSLGGS